MMNRVTVLYVTGMASVAVSTGAFVETMWGLGVGSLVFGLALLAPVFATRVGGESKSRK